MQPRIRLTLLCIALAAFSAAAIPTVAGAVDFPEGVNGPDINLPGPEATAKFKVTISGGQRDSTQFFRAPIVDGCSLHLEGSLLEGWAFQRNTSVTMEFTKYGSTVLMQRTGRQAGDTAFATKGQLRREATGFFKIMSATGCLTFNLPQPACFKTVSAPLDMRLDYLKGRITLAGSGPSASVKNPLEQCGLMQQDSGSFDHLSNPYPHLHKQKGSLSARQIFGKKKRLRVVLKPKFLAPADAGGFTSFTEKLVGDSTLELVRK